MTKYTMIFIRNFSNRAVAMSFNVAYQNPQSAQSPLSTHLDGWVVFKARVLGIKYSQFAESFHYY